MAAMTSVFLTTSTNMYFVLMYVLLQYLSTYPSINLINNFTTPRLVGTEQDPDGNLTILRTLYIIPAV